MPYAAQLSPVPRNPLRGPSVIVAEPRWSAAALFVALQDYARAPGYMKVVELAIEKAVAPG
jgi:hypothetical protein